MNKLKQLWKDTVELTKEKSSVQKWLDVSVVALAGVCCGMYIISGNVFAAVGWGIITLLDSYNLILH